MNKNRYLSIQCRSALCVVLVCIAGCTNCPVFRNTSAPFSEVIKRHEESDWHLYFANSVGGLYELDLAGRISRVFAITNRFTEVGYSTSLNRFVIFEELYLGPHIAVPDVPHKVPTYELLMHHVDFRGHIDRTIRIPQLQRGIGDAVFAPSGHYALVTANSRERVAERRGPNDYDCFSLEDVYRIDTTIGAVQLLLQGSCRDLGNIHPREDSFLFTNAEGIICSFSLLDHSTTSLVWGSRALWNSDASAIGFVKALQWHRQKGNTSRWSLTGDQSVEYEYDPEKKEERRIGRAGTLYIWSPDRKVGIRFFHFDSLIKGVNRARAVIESSDSGHRSTIIKNMSFPWSPVWIAVPDTK